MVYKITAKMAEDYMPGCVVLNIHGMNSSQCEDTLKNAALKCNGVNEARASHKNGEVIIDTNITQININEIKSVVESAGFLVNSIYFNTEF